MVLAPLRRSPPTRLRISSVLFAIRRAREVVHRHHARHLVVTQAVEVERRGQRASVAHGRRPGQGGERFRRKIGSVSR